MREREKAEIALFISLEQPTPAMVKDAASVGFYESAARKKFARVQLLTIDGLLDNTQRAEHPDYEPDLKRPRERRCDSGKRRRSGRHCPAATAAAALAVRRVPLVNRRAEAAGLETRWHLPTDIPRLNVASRKGTRPCESPKIVLIYCSL